MRSESICDVVREDLSAYIDAELSPARRDEIETHLASCRACTEEESALRAVRRLVRIQAVEDVPDLAPAILARVRRDHERRSLRPWREPLRVGAVAAAASALVIFGASLPFDRGGRVAVASEITSGVRSAARTLHGYRARFRIEERGWHEEVPVRRMVARVGFRAPEDVRVEIRDRTRYPSEQWPRNDVTLVADQARSWIEEPSSCPPLALPECASPVTWAGVIERRLVVEREPFDGTSGAPTDIVLPLETLAAERGFQVLGEDTIAGRSAWLLALDHRQALPLIGALQVGGAWRDFHPLDRVDLWIDAETWFPLRYEVHAGSSPDRPLWATRHGYDDDAGAMLLRVEVTSFSEPRSFSSTTFATPSSGQRRSGGFSERDVARRGPRPSYRAGLSAYRSGVTSDGRVLVSYADGASYLKVLHSRERIQQGALMTAEEIALPKSGFAYYFPASAVSGRRILLATSEGVVELQTNLPRHELIRVASSLDVRGTRIPSVARKAAGVTTRRVSPEHAVQPHEVLAPGYLPEAYRPSSATVAVARDGVRSTTLYYRRTQGEFDGSGIRVVQSSPVTMLPPSSEEFVGVRIGDLQGRWSVERGELEWVDAGSYRSVLVPSADLYTALRIAESLR